MSKPVLSRQLSQPPPTPKPLPQRTDDEWTYTSYPAVGSPKTVPPPPPLPSSKNDDKSKPSEIPPNVKDKLRVDLSKLDPRDEDAVKAAEQTVGFLLGAGNSGYGAATKHTYGRGTDVYFINTQTNNTVVYDSSAFSNNGVGFSLIGYVFEGDSVGDRLGRKIFVKHTTLNLDITWSVVGQSTGAGAQNIAIFGNSFPPVRVVIFRDKMSMAAAPTNMETKANSGSFSDVSALFHNVYNSDTVVNYVTAPWNLTTHGYRYEILHDEVINAPTDASSFSYGVSGATYAASARKHHTIHKKLDRQVIFEDDNTTSSSNICKNNIYVCFFTDVMGSANTWNITPFVDYAFDTAFVDN